MTFRCLLVFAAMHAGWLTPAAAEDIVTIASGRGQTKIGGRVIEYTGRELRLQLADGREKSFPAEQIVRVDTKYTTGQTEADRLFAQSKFAQALALYRKALDGEPRRWVRRQIIAQMVWCYRALGQDGLAAEAFLLLVRSDPSTPLFDCIPLAWVPAQPSVALEQTARQWLARDDLPAAVLLGASHLLSTSSRPAALTRLQRLAATADRRIAQLARAQTWRAAVATADDQQLAAWRGAIDEMPEPLRAGPRFVLGRALAYKKRWEEAALEFLHVPILYTRHRHLAARCLLDAARSLEKLGRPKQAAGLYSELIESHPKTRPAAEARSRLEELRKPTKPQPLVAHPE